MDGQNNISTSLEIYSSSHIFCSILDPYDEYHKIYTDASKNENGFGFFILFCNKQILHRLPSFYSIFTADALRICIAI